MPLPIDVLVENCHGTVGTAGYIPIFGAVQWTDPPSSLTDFTTFESISGAQIVEPLGPSAENSAVLNLGSKGTFAAYLGSMATQTTRRVHVPGVPLDPGERVTGTLETGTVASTTFAGAGDGLFTLGADRPGLEFDGVAVTLYQTTLRDFNPFREVQEIEGRDATYGAWYQWRLIFHPTTGRVEWTMTLAYTDERKSDRVIAWPLVRMSVPAAWGLHIDNSARCAGEAQYVVGDTRYWDLVPAHTIHDAQAARFRGTFFVGGTPGDADYDDWLAMPGNRTGTPRISAQPEEYRGKLFFWDGLPARPPSRDEASCRDRYERFRESMEDRSSGVNDYTRRPYDSENHARAREAATQPDFAAGPFYAVFFRENGNLLRLPELDAAGDRHMSRPLTQRRKGLDDGDPLAARIVRWGDYPARDFILQGEYIFFRVITGDTDVRGKSLEAPNDAPRYYRGMTGFVRSHFSIYHAIEAMFLTGCFDAEDIVRQHIEWFLYEWIADREVYHARCTQLRFARIMSAMSWAWLCTGDARIPNRFNELADIEDLVWERYSDHVAADQPFRWLGLNNTNETVEIGGVERTLRGTTADPWQVSMCEGYYAAYQLTGNEFYLQLVRDITRTWLYTWRFGYYHNTNLQRRGPQWHQMFKLIYPGLNGNPGTYGEFPPIDWLSEANERVYWRAFDDTLWTPHMLALAMVVHADERATHDIALAIYAALFPPWFEDTDVTIFDTRGEWFGDDARLVGYNDDLTFDAGEDRETITEPGFSFEGTAEDLLIVADAETEEASEPAFTYEAGDLEIDAPAIIETTVEPGFEFEFGDDVDLIVDPEIEQHVEGEPGVQTFELELTLDLTHAAEVEEAAESTATFYETTDSDLLAAAEIEQQVEPGAVFEVRDVSAARTSARIDAYSGASPVTAYTGAAKLRGESTP